MDNGDRINPLGYRGRIKQIQGSIQDPLVKVPGYRMENFRITIELENPVEGVKEFVFDIPAIDYNEENLRRMLEAEAEEALRYIFEEARKREIEKKRWEDRKKDLDAKGARLLEILKGGESAENTG